MQRHKVEQIIEFARERTDLPSPAHERTIAETVDSPTLLTMRKEFDVNKVVPQEMCSDCFFF